MSLESGTRIQDLVATNPVGATDFVSQGDDHIRLIKACLQGSFPSLGATAVARTAAELNDIVMKSVAQTIAQLLTLSGGLTVSGGAVTLPAASLADAALSNNVPLKNAANTFTVSQTVTNVSGVALTVNSASDNVAVFNSIGTSPFISLSAGGVRKAYINYDASAGLLLTNEQNTNSVIYTNNAQRLVISGPGNTTINTPASGTTLTLNGAASAYAQVINSPNTAGSSYGLRILAGTNSADFNTVFTNAANTATLGLIYGDGSFTWGNAPTGGNKGAGTINAQDLYKNGVRTESLPAITSTSTTLVKGQMHHIAGNATLPALGDGEWICIVNNSASAITITEHSGDATYWTAAGVSVSTLTVPARGRIFASGAGGSVVYVSGDVSGYT